MISRWSEFGCLVNLNEFLPILVKLKANLWFENATKELNTSNTWTLNLVFRLDEWRCLSSIGHSNWVTVMLKKKNHTIRWEMKMFEGMKLLMKLFSGRGKRMKLLKRLDAACHRWQLNERRLATSIYAWARLPPAAEILQLIVLLIWVLLVAKFVISLGNCALCAPSLADEKRTSKVRPAATAYASILQCDLERRRISAFIGVGQAMTSRE